ncbi:MAG: phosphoenolpyruvate carboxykinase (ATP), partial [Flavobacteriales bacterium]|nr:phosphoenolpyruvate carboxykinase (ATP) [Flavobacteriales bacterium]
MIEHGFKSPKASLETIGLGKVKTSYWNLSPAELVQHSLNKGMGRITDTGALAVNTGKFTGRSPKDKFTVKDALTEHSVDWGDINIPISPANFDKLYNAMTSYLEGKEIY